MRVFGAILLVASVLTSSTVALSEDSAVEARAAFKNAVRLFEDGKFAEAAEEFRRANELNANWKLLYNIGQAEAASGRNGLALESFEEYLTRAADEISVKRREEVLEEVKRLREVVGSLDIEAPDGAVITVDGTERGVTPLSGSVLVSAGVEHEVEILLDGEVILSRAVKLSGRQTRTLVAEPGAEAGPPTEEPPGETPDAPAPAGEPANGLKIAGWTLLGVGGAALIGGAIAGGVAVSKNGDLESQCSDDAICPPDARETYDQGERSALASTVLFPVGGAVAATGAILLIVNASREGEAPAVSIAPVLDGGRGGVRLSGRF